MFVAYITNLLFNIWQDHYPFLFPWGSAFNWKQQNKTLDSPEQKKKGFLNFPPSCTCQWKSLSNLPKVYQSGECISLFFLLWMLENYVRYSDQNVEYVYEVIRFWRQTFKEAVFRKRKNPRERKMFIDLISIDWTMNWTIWTHCFGNCSYANFPYIKCMMTLQLNKLLIYSNII